MKNKIKTLFSKAYSKLFRKKTRRTIWGNGEGIQEAQLRISPECFRKQFEEAYPDAAKLLEATSVKRIGGVEMFVIKGELAAKNLHVLQSNNTPVSKLDE